MGDIFRVKIHDPVMDSEEHYFLNCFSRSVDWEIKNINIHRI